MTKTLLAVIFIIAIVVGGWFVLSNFQNAPAQPAPASSSQNGNAASFGTPATGTTPSPSASSHGSPQISPGSNALPIVGDNFMLGIGQNSVLGTYLVGYTGMALYTYEHDTGASSTCYAQCAQIWPPYVVSPSDRENFQYGVNSADFGTTERTDGTLQVTYKGHPLYFYSGDTTANSTNGQGFGGVWYVIAP